MWARLFFPRQCDLATALGLINGVQYDFGKERFVIKL